MSIRDLELLSPTIGDYVAKARRENPGWFALADRIRKLSQDLLLGIEPGPEPLSLLMLLLFARAATSYQAALLLIERGMPADARTLVRSVLESTVYFGMATQEPNFHLRLAGADRRDKINYTKPILAMGPERSGLNQSTIEALQA